MMPRAILGIALCLLAGCLGTRPAPQPMSVRIARNAPALAAFDCFVVHATGPGIADDATLPACLVAYGTVSPFATLSTAQAKGISVFVPNGPQRQVELLGVQNFPANPGCGGATTLADLFRQSTAVALYSIGQQTVDTSNSSDTQVILHTGNYSASTPNLAASCPNSVTLTYAQMSPTFDVGQPIATDVPSIAVPVSSYSVTPSLPAGVTLDSATGNIGGTPLVDFFATAFQVTATTALGAFSATLNLAAVFPWSGVRQLGQASHDATGTSVAVDPNGGAVAAGYTDGPFDGQSLTGTTDFFVTRYDAFNTKQWTRTLGATSATTTAYGVATDSSTNVWVTGSTTGNLDGQTLTGTTDLFFTKYDSSGNRKFTQLLGVAGHTTAAHAIATDSSGNAYVTGQTNGAIVSLHGTQDYVLAKYPAGGGTATWIVQDGVGGSFTTASAVTVDNSGNVYLVGVTGGDLDSQTLIGSVDAFVSKYSSTGTLQWTQLLGASPGGTQGFGVGVDSSGNVYVGGYTSGSLPGNSISGTYDLFAAKYNSSGSRQWVTQTGYTGTTAFTTTMAVDASGNVTVCGQTNGALNATTPLVGVEGAFAVGFTSGGAIQWTKILSGAASTSTAAGGCAADIAGSVFMVGNTTGNLGSNTLTGVQDMFVAQFGSSGTLH